MAELGSQLLLAHAGHWTVWALYCVPVLAVIIAIVVSSLRARRRESRPPASEGPAHDRPED